MAIKKKKIIQCPLCDSNRLYLRKGLISDILISLIVPVRSYSCGSCSSNFRRFGNYFTSKQALVHIIIVCALIVFFKPNVFSTEFWTFSKNDTAAVALKQSSANTSALKISEGNASLVSENTSQSITEAASTTTTAALNSTANATENSPLSKEELTAKADSSDQPEPQVENSNKNIEAKADSGHIIKTKTSGVLSSLYFSEQGKKTKIRLDLGGAPLSYTSFFLKNPSRLVIDVLGKWEYKGQNVLTPENPVFSKFRIGVYPDKIRLVMDLKGQSPAPVIKKTETGLNITLK